MKRSIKLQFILLGFLISFSTFAQQKQVNLLDSNFQDFYTSDSLFLKPYVDVDEWRVFPSKHRYVHGGFEGTETKFSFYFPEPDEFNGRFFQYITPFPDNEFLSQGAQGEEDKIGFSISHGAYFIETNGGGKVDFSKPSLQKDPTIGAYRANAAAASFSRLVASKIYNCNRPFGYAFGGSGGAYRTIVGIENTHDVWDGVVPYVLGSPMAIPNVFSARMNAMRILNNKFPQIVDGMDAGGSGNIYANLNEEEMQAMQEVTKLGFPPKSWFGFKTMGIHGFIALYQGMKMADGSYFDDFWKVKGYLGANPTKSLLDDRIQVTTKVKALISYKEALKLGLKQPESESERGTADLAWKSLGGVEGELPVAIQLNNEIPEVNFMGGDLVIKSGESSGQTIQIATVLGDKITFGPVNLSVLAKLKPGDDVVLDNSNFLAVQTYHRHQVPGKEYKVWDQFRNQDGTPLYPQRPMLLGPMFTKGAAGVLPTGKFNGKMILLCSLWDREAFPWQGDFYKNKVNDHLGRNLNQHFRLWYTDRALHGDQSSQEFPNMSVSYLGVLHQALLDLSSWVEKGIAPASSTNYRIEEGQVIIPKKANHRKGIQPVIKLVVNDGEKAKVKIGESVSFKAEIQVPNKIGKVVSATWVFGDSDNKEDSVSFEPNYRVLLTKKHIFLEPGTYFVTLKSSAQRAGNKSTPYTQIKNLERVRVIVSK